MENEQEQPIEQEQPVVEDVVEQVVEQVQSEPEADRPEINYQKELERRKANEERLQRELEAERAKQTNRYDANDLNTWGDNDLYALKNSMDPNHIQYKQKAEDILFDRKIERARERERLAEKRTRSEMELRTKFPQALDAASSFAVEMEQVMYDLDLQKSPAGRLAAAEIVAARNQKGTGKATDAGRKKEEARLKDVKQTLFEGDRPDPRQSLPKPQKTDDLMKLANDSKSKEEQSKAFGEVLKTKGFDRDSFFKR